jgi:hypothetical protein
MLSFDEKILQSIIFRTGKNGASGLLFVCRKFEFLCKILARLKSKEINIVEYRYIHHLVGNRIFLNRNLRKLSENRKSANLNKAFEFAMENDFVNIAMHILQNKNFNPSKRDNNLVLFAYRHKHMELVEMMLSHKNFDPLVNDNALFVFSCAGGYLKLVKLLLKDNRVDPSFPDNAAIIVASANGRSKTVKCLLKQTSVDPTEDNYKALILALQKNNFNVIHLLHADERVKNSQYVHQLELFLAN